MSLGMIPPIINLAKSTQAVYLKKTHHNGVSLGVYYISFTDALCTLTF